MGTHTLCWDCTKAVGGCAWSTLFKPIEGWKAQEIKATSTKPYTTYLVEECPEFERDAYSGGTVRPYRTK